MLEQFIEFCDENCRPCLSEVCKNCNRKNGCSGSCSDCLDEIHFSHSGEGRSEYNCKNLLNYYVCRYQYAYASEILYALRVKDKWFRNLSQYNVLSIGAGPSPDLFALYRYIKQSELGKTINYLGFDCNENWKRQHRKIHELADERGIKVQYKYEDAISFFKEKSVEDSNIIVMQYFLSSINYSRRGEEIASFLNSVLDNVIMKATENIYIIINDINHYIVREHVYKFLDNLNCCGIKSECCQYFFPYDNINDAQRGGNSHQCTELLYKVSDDIYDNYNIRKSCRSEQFIIEVRR